jgi:ABC-2 type transport system ATP-binding protein
MRAACGPGSIESMINPDARPARERQTAHFPAGDTVVEARALTKRYGAVQAVTGLTFTIERGTITGFLGPNGAGKTTTVRILVTLLKPTWGTARVCGFDVAR